ncbi:DEKNAAC102887 [Brettanomyces naardenensis]|uniref:Phosphoserine aminotransferase n=1 Tax=Brettanomyces naardenensis TaxID=13370 RepID=A0A448YLQ5_BRENA|nr:DEKNAAC102887 [Brettanomyces naardenensis]
MSLQREEPNYFGAGPAQLPTAVLQQAAKDLVNFKEIGIGAGEISHRSAPGVAIIDDTKAYLKKLWKVPDTHEVFFLQGGGTTGFSSVPTNLVASFVKKTGKVGKPAYVITGSWSKKAYEEAVRLGFDAQVVVNSKTIEGKFGDIPDVDQWKIPSADDTPFVYYCDNETVHGVEFREFPVDHFKGIEIVADMSSNFLSKPVDFSKYGLVFGGAQKNVGIAGVTIYIIKKSLLDHASDEELRKLNVPISPIAFDYPTVVSKDSAYNTIPTFNVHIIELVLEKLIENGGIDAQQEKNIKKSELLYSTLEKYPSVYHLPVTKRARSRMNVVFTIKDGSLDSEFLKEAAAAKLTGLKGHRSVGGMRASLYNAVSLHSVELLADFAEKFAEAHK